MKKNKITFWITTSLIFLLEGVLPLLTANSEEALNGLHNLGYPLYFGGLLIVFKVLGALVLMLSKVNRRIKEWAYAGFAFNFTSALVSNLATYGFGYDATLALIMLGVLALSYRSLNKIEPIRVHAFA